MASPIVRFFTFDHLKDPELRAVSSHYRDLALNLDADLPDGAEKSTALRKLLESKDAAVRAALPVPTSNPTVADGAAVAVEPYE